MREVVVCTHGIWMKGLAMKPLARYLNAHGHECKQFFYQSVRREPQENALKLGEFVDKLDADIIHFVAHSLGGIILLYYFRLFDVIKPGRVVMLGTPARGSDFARHMSKHNSIKNKVLGASANSLLGCVPSWSGARPLAVFAGTRGAGLGRILGAPLDKPNDGTVAVSETAIENCALHLQVPYSHIGLLLANPVANSVDEFLRTGNVT